MWNEHCGGGGKKIQKSLCPKYCNIFCSMRHLRLIWNSKDFSCRWRHFVGVFVTVPAFSITSDWSSPLITHQWLDLICPVDTSDRDLSRSPDSCYWLWEICQLKERDVGGLDPVCPWRRIETCLITSCSNSLLGLVDLQVKKSRFLQTSLFFFHVFYKHYTSGFFYFIYLYKLNALCFSKSKCI